MPPIQKNANTFVATSEKISANSIEAFGNYWPKCQFFEGLRGINLKKWPKIDILANNFQTLH